MLVPAYDTAVTTSGRILKSILYSKSLSLVIPVRELIRLFFIRKKHAVGIFGIQGKSCLLFSPLEYSFLLKTVNFTVWKISNCVAVFSVLFQLRSILLKLNKLKYIIMHNLLLFLLKYLQNENAHYCSGKLFL